MSADPTIELIEARVRAVLAANAKRPFVLGIAGAQGSGKSTVSAGLASRLATSGWRVALFSLDDLYLPREDREAMAASVHPLFRTRGVPGTHDTALGEALLVACGCDGGVAMPRFAKEMDTRLPESEWSRITTPVDIVIFEGWCVGARPQRETDLSAPVNPLEAREDGNGIWRRHVNQRLAGDYQRLFARIDYLVLLAAPGFGVVSVWRREQEHKLRAALAVDGRRMDATLDDAGVDRFIQHYQRITDHMLTEMPGRADLCIFLDADRRPSMRGPDDGEKVAE